jgi:shikimate kinase
MRGVGRSSAAISVLNAIPTGIGCAHGVRLYTAVTVELEERDATRVEVEPASSATPVVVGALAGALAHFRPGLHFSAHLQVDSEIPVAKGLKSSSAVATATIQAVAKALDREPPAVEVAAWAAQVSRAAGVSATGAFDDALAGLVPGFVLTDNRTGHLLSRRPSDPAWTAVLHVPQNSHPPSPSFQAAFRQSKAEGDAAAEAARLGAWADAMDRNTRLVERVMGYDYQELRAATRAAGAVASSVSGLGPAFVSLVPRSHAAAVLDVMPAERFVVPLTSEEHP